MSIQENVLKLFEDNSISVTKRREVLSTLVERYENQAKPKGVKKTRGRRKTKGI